MVQVGGSLRRLLCTHATDAMAGLWAAEMGPVCFTLTAVSYFSLSPRTRPGEHSRRLACPTCTLGLILIIFFSGVDVHGLGFSNLPECFNKSPSSSLIKVLLAVYTHLSIL